MWLILFPKCCILPWALNLGKGSLKTGFIYSFTNKYVVCDCF